MVKGALPRLTRSLSREPDDPAGTTTTRRSFDVQNRENSTESSTRGHQAQLPNRSLEERSPRMPKDTSLERGQRRSWESSRERSHRRSKERSPQTSRIRSPRRSKERSLRRPRERSPRRSRERSSQRSRERSPG